MKARILETRALPTIEEQRNALLDEMDSIVEKSKNETRAFTEDESKRFEEIKVEIAKIDKTLKAQEEARSMEKISKKDDQQLEQRALDEKKILSFIRGEERALDIANNGAIIPTTISSRIIEKVKELSPIYSMATIYNVGGDLAFPVYDETAPIQASYVDDLTELTEQTGKFTTVKLQNFIVGCLWAEIRPLSGRELLAAESINSEITQKINIRYFGGIFPNMRVKFGNRYFQIIYIMNFQELNVELQLMCKELYPNG